MKKKAPALISFKNGVIEFQLSTTEDLKRFRILLGLPINFTVSIPGVGKAEITVDDYQAVADRMNQIMKAAGVEAQKLFEQSDTASLKDMENHINEHPPSALAIVLLVLLAKAEQKTTQARAAAIAKRANNPKDLAKEKEKQFIFECWQAWQETPSQYKNQAKFAIAMLDKCEYLESSNVIEGWCREWKTENGQSAG